MSLKKIIFGFTIFLLAILLFAFFIGSSTNEEFNVTERSINLSNDISSSFENDDSSRLNSKNRNDVITGAISVARAKALGYAQSNGNSYIGFCEAEAPKEAGGVYFDCVDSEKEYRISAKVEDGLYICTAHNINSSTFAELSSRSTEPTGYSCHDTPSGL